jgi:hypothetical protein
MLPADLLSMSDDEIEQHRVSRTGRARRRLAAPALAGMPGFASPYPSYAALRGCPDMSICLLLNIHLRV